MFLQFIKLSPVDVKGLTEVSYKLWLYFRTNCDLLNLFEQMCDCDIRMHSLNKMIKGRSNAISCIQTYLHRWVGFACWTWPKLKYISAVKKLIVINRIHNKSFCWHNICVCVVYIYYVYINTHTYIQHIFWKYLHVYVYIHIIYIIYKYI